MYNKFMNYTIIYKKSTEIEEIIENVQDKKSPRTTNKSRKNLLFYNNIDIDIGSKNFYM